MADLAEHITNKKSLLNWQDPIFGLASGEIVEVEAFVSYGTYDVSRMISDSGKVYYEAELYSHQDLDDEDCIIGQFGNAHNAKRACENHARIWFIEKI